MFLKSINLTKVYNFGDDGTPELSELKQFNLFIGKNGSGKTNALKAISDIDVLTHASPNGSSKEKIELNVRSWNFKIDRTNKVGVGYGREKVEIILAYEGDIVEFKDERHVRGDFRGLSADLLPLTVREGEFKDLFSKLDGSRITCELLNFTLFYIFNLYFTVSNESITELFTRGEVDKRGVSGKVLAKTDVWASGYLAVVNLLVQMLVSEKPIVCMDEPEVNLEPRIIRNLFKVLVWISSKKTKIDYGGFV